MLNSLRERKDDNVDLRQHGWAEKLGMWQWAANVDNREHDGEDANVNNNWQRNEQRLPRSMPSEYVRSSEHDDFKYQTEGEP